MPAEDVAILIYLIFFVSMIFVIDKLHNKKNEP